MNKKKSKALAFLLAASLLVPSANVVVSAAELEEISRTENNILLNNTNESVENTDENVKKVTTEKELKEAVASAKENEVIEIESDITLTSAIELNKKGLTIRGKNLENDNKVSLKYTKTFFEIKNDQITIENIKFIETKNNDEGRFIWYGNVECKINKCDFLMGDNVEYVHTIMYTGDGDATDNRKLTFTNNTIKANCRAAFVGVYNNAIIENNYINMVEEHFKGPKKGRTGVISLIAKSNGGKVSIKNNIFENANRAIGVDRSNLEGEKIEISENKFINTRFAFEVGSGDLDNKGKSYDLSDNYYKYDENVGPLRIEDANASGSHFEDGTSTELKIKDETPFNIVVGPYYTVKDKNGKLSNPAHAGVATVNEKDYARLEKAIRAAKPGDTVKLVSDITVDKWNQISGIKGITIDGDNHTIKVNDEVYSNGNNDAILHSSGGNKFENIKIDLSTVSKKSNIEGIRAIDANNGDVIYKVEIIGGNFISYGITASGEKKEEGCKNITVTNSKISNCGHGIFFGNLKYDKETEIKIEQNNFDGCEYASILYPTGVTFENNTVKGGKLNIMNDSTVVQKNTFTTDASKGSSRVKFYTEGNEKTFKYNKIVNGEDGKVGATVEFASASDTGSAPIDSTKADLSKNFWGDKNPRFDKIFVDTDNKVNEQTISKITSGYFETVDELDNALKPSTGSGGGVITPTYTHKEIIGSDRYDTAARIADQLGSYDTVVLVNATSTMSDGLSASGLAGKENGAILLVKKDSIPKVTMDRIKKVKKVYIIGGESAISAKVANEITAANIKVERLGGKTRVETSKIVAEKLGNYKDAFVVNGFKGEADAMSASAVAAKNKAPILLTNGKESTHDKKTGVKYYVIGGNNVVDKSIADKYSAEVLAGKDRYATNREVIDEFYSGSDKLYLANGDKLVDALTASPLAKKDGIVLVNEKSDKSILKGKNTVQVGGMDFEIKFEK